MASFLFGALTNFLRIYLSCRWIKQSEKIAAEAEQPDLTPKLDLSFKEGQTIHINLGVSIMYSR